MKIKKNIRKLLKFTFFLNNFVINCNKKTNYFFLYSGCLHPLGMADGFIPDNSITASSSTSGHEAKQARATLENDC